MVGTGFEFLKHGTRANPRLDKPNAYSFSQMRRLTTLSDSLSELSRCSNVKVSILLHEDGRYSLPASADCRAWLCYGPSISDMAMSSRPHRAGVDGRQSGP